MPQSEMGRALRRFRFVARTEKDRSGDEIYEAARALGKFRHPKAIQAFESATHAEGYYLRRMAVAALARMKHPDVINQLAWSLHIDKDSDVRWYAFEGLARFEEKTPAWAVKHLIPMLGHSNDTTRKAAVKLLVKIAQNNKDKPLPRSKGKALMLVGPHLREEDNPVIVFAAIQQARAGNVVPKNARLYVKQLRAMEGKLK